MPVQYSEPNLPRKKKKNFTGADRAVEFARKRVIYAERKEAG
jgi:hypothetical protein